MAPTLANYQKQPFNRKVGEVQIVIKRFNGSRIREVREVEVSIEDVPVQLKLCGPGQEETIRYYFFGSN